MANVNISEYADLEPRTNAPAVKIPALAVQNVAIGGSSVQSAGFQTATVLVRVCADAVAWVSFGSNPTAVANGAATLRLAANVPEYFGVNAGDRIAVITGT